MNVLLVCDDSNEETSLSYAVQHAGLDSLLAPDVDSALTLYAQRPAELVILALRGDLLAAARRLRRAVGVPLLVIIDEMTEDEQITLIDVAEAILVARPYSARLLGRQMLVFLRLGDSVPRSALTTLRGGEVTLDPDQRTVRVGDRPVRQLAKREYTLLYVLMQHPGQVMATSTLIEHVWGYDYGDESLLRNLVWHVRQKVEPLPKQPRYIMNVSGVGYRFEPDDGT